MGDMKPASERTINVDFELTRAEARDDGFTLEGYAAVFNSDTTIDSWEGQFVERIAPGAFAKTISERTPVMQFDHGHHPFIGSIPIAAIQTLREDSRGLFVRARMLDNDLVKPVRDAIAAGAIRGMSFRFGVVKDDWDHSGDMPVRTLMEVRLHELGPVVHPAYEDTTVGVRSKLAESFDEIFATQEMREAFARWFAFGTCDEAARQGTSEEAAAVKKVRPNPARVRVLREKASDLKGGTK